MLITKRHRWAANILVAELKSEEYGWADIEFRSDGLRPWKVSFPLRQWLDADGKMQYRERIQKAAAGGEPVALMCLEDAEGRAIPETCWP